MAFWANRSTENEVVKRVAPLVVNLLATEGVQIKDSEEVLGEAFNIIIKPVCEATEKVREEEKAKRVLPIKK